MKKTSFFLALATSLALAACGNSSAEKPATETPTGPVTETPAESVTDTKTAAPEESSTPTVSGVSKALAEMTQGTDDAPVTLIEYASVTCPGCAYFHKEFYPRLKTDYIATGKVKFVFREFPTPPQQLAYAGFVLSRCTAETRGPDAYFAMLQTLFSNRDAWVSENAKTELLKYTAQAGMSEDDFNACLEREDILEAINENIKYGSETYNVESTPTFILNDERMERYSTEEEFFQLLDEAIAAAEAG